MSEKLNPIAEARKNSRGEWIASTDHKLPEAFNQYGNEGKPMVLRITTSKSQRGGIETCATTHTPDGYFECHRVFHDVSVKLSATPAKRVTEKAVREAHNQALDDWTIADLEELCLNRYEYHAAKHG